MSSFSRSDEQFSRFEDEEPLRHRGRVVWRAVFFTLGALLVAGAGLVATYKIATGDSGFLVMWFIAGGIGLPLAYFAVSYVRDLGAKPVVHEGEILRKWSKGNLAIFFFPSFYIMVQDKVYSITRREYAMLLEDDLVRITCYPHSLTVERLERYDSTEKQFVSATSGAIT